MLWTISGKMASAPKRQKCDSVPNEIEKEIRAALKSTFPKNPEAAANAVNIVPSNSSKAAHQYQFHCGQVSKAVSLPFPYVVTQIRESFPCSGKFHKSK